MSSTMSPSPTPTGVPLSGATILLLRRLQGIIRYCYCLDSGLMPLVTISHLGLPLHGTCLARDLRRGFLRFGVLV
ncbi:hypothetical protein POTOM_038046 [Populus tomentosa]|uniref:Uncharacterized protein n=1 Tax=Populus tomentosa TaxID=118781 RepID=A0A8X7YUX7_POPTO|nr:hypothetical protein POTOM_038046 [Populus tomentosa]